MKNRTTTSHNLVMIHRMVATFFHHFVDTVNEDNSFFI